MAQQINLCPPKPLTQRRYLSAHAMLIMLGITLVLGAILCGFWVWSYDKAIAALTKSGALQAQEVENLKGAIAQNRLRAAPAAPALLEQLQRVRAAVLQREKLQQALQEGAFQPGWAHSDRLAWVAQSIPDTVWITDVRIGSDRFDVTGYTLEPQALNEWVGRLSASPLMQNLKLASVRVDHASVTQAVIPGAAASGISRAAWSFNLVSVAPPPAAASDVAPTPGGRP